MSKESAVARITSTAAGDTPRSPADFLSPRRKLVNKYYIAEMLGIEPVTVVKMAQGKRIPHYKFGHRSLRFDEREVLAWLEKKQVPANPFTLVKVRR
ncbi:MAG TPA: hypothetical protein DHV16_10030 [Nitrospiraceae bacterium]|nr:hypothetical protein [Nitrospiraceae bacterium]HCZ12565.1 hypothetical protein [Nitrospiraceae bacterium]